MGKKEKKEKEVYVPIAGVLGEAEDYHIYEMTPIDRIVAALIGFAIGAVVIYVFFRSIPFAAIIGAVFAVPAQKFYQEYKKKKRQQNLLMQFKDLLESLASSYSSGQNTPRSFHDAKEDMISIYGESADIVEEVGQIVNGIANGVKVEHMLTNFAQRSGLDDVESFANVFEVANRQGSNLNQVIAETRDIINDKIEIEMEIETMLQGNKNELNIMICMPLVIVASLSGLGTMTIASNTPLNVILKVVCIGIFGAAYLMGSKIVDIKV